MRSLGFTPLNYLMPERLPEEELTQSSQRGRPNSDVDPEEVKFPLSKGSQKQKLLQSYRSVDKHYTTKFLIGVNTIFRNTP